MFKLVVVGGKLRGKEYTLNEGDNVLGRDSDVDVPFFVEGVSKKHISLNVNNEHLTLTDLGSSNGTFVNGKLVKRIALKPGDKIGLPNSILQVVYLIEKKIVVKKKAAPQVVMKEETLEELLDGKDPPTQLLPKVFWMFRYKILKPLYTVNMEYEWRVLLGVLTAIFAIITITLTIFPVLQDSKKILVTEISIRGAHYADLVSKFNVQALANKNWDAVDTRFLEDNVNGIASYELFDLDGRIIRPLSKLNEYTNDAFSVQSREWASKKSQNEIFQKFLDDGEIGIGKKIFAYNPRTGLSEIIGVLAIRFAPKTLAIEASNSSKAYLESLITSFLVGIIFYGAVYFMTLRPLEELKFQLEDALRGKRKIVDSKILFEELNGVKSSINTSLQRIRELSNVEEEIDPNDVESDQSYVNTMLEFMLGAANGAMVLNSEKNLIKINSQAEDLCGIRQSSSVGMNIMDITREKGFAATIIELCDMSANNGGTSQQGRYELMGKEYSLYVNSLIGKDNFAKAFYVSFLIEN
jgi:pSer/pThr/pTyr-binding forkhead associated (FHA) protein